MGACDFYTRAKGKTAKEAFDEAQSEAHYQHGNNGYTGSIAEKHTFTMVKVAPGVDPQAHAQRIIDEDDDRNGICDKTGPAGCIDLGNGEFLFFGVARC